MNIISAVSIPVDNVLGNFSGLFSGAAQNAPAGAFMRVLSGMMFGGTAGSAPAGLSRGQQPGPVVAGIEGIIQFISQSGPRIPEAFQELLESFRKDELSPVQFLQGFVQLLHDYSAELAPLADEMMQMIPEQVLQAADSQPVTLGPPAEPIEGGVRGENFAEANLPAPTGPVELAQSAIRMQAALPGAGEGVAPSPEPSLLVQALEGEEPSDKEIQQLPAAKLGEAILKLLDDFAGFAQIIETETGVNLEDLYLALSALSERLNMSIQTEMSSPGRLIEAIKSAIEKLGEAVRSLRDAGQLTPAIDMDSALSGNVLQEMLDETLAGAEKLIRFLDAMQGKMEFIQVARENTAGTFRPQLSQAADSVQVQGESSQTAAEEIPQAFHSPASQAIMDDNNIYTRKDISVSQSAVEAEPGSDEAILSDGTFTADEHKASAAVSNQELLAKFGRLGGESSSLKEMSAPEAPASQAEGLAPSGMQEPPALSQSRPVSPVYAPEGPEDGPGALVNGIVRFARLHSTGGTSRVSMNLHPPELGKLRIIMTVRDGSVYANLRTETEAARSMILANMGQLKETLSLQGLRLEQVSVNLDANEQGAWFASPGDGSDRQWQQDGANGHEGLEPEMPEEELATMLSGGLFKNGRLDVVV